jgi:hypothetical protein
MNEQTGVMGGHRGRIAVMAERVETRDGLDDFPTPPWGTRALYRHVLPRLGYDLVALHSATAWEPAAGRGIMSRVLEEFHCTVFASDVHDYGCGFTVGSFVGDLLDMARCPFKPDWIITNPPFKLGTEFAERALSEAQEGVVLLARTAWIESAERYDLFRRWPLTAVAPFSSRLAMVKGRFDPSASTATSYAWFVWSKSHSLPDPRVIFIPPDAKAHCVRDDDAARFASPET